MSAEITKGFLVAATLASAVVGGRAEAATATKDEISTETIDRALLETEFTVLGIGASFQQSFLQRQASRSEMACLDSKLTPLVRDHFDSAKKSALTLEELQQGNELASVSVFPKITGYIVYHREQLNAQIESTKVNLSHYFLITAAIRTNQPPDEYRQVEDFIAWHSRVHPRISEAVVNQTPQFVQDVAIVFVSCRNAP